MDLWMRGTGMRVRLEILLTFDSRVGGVAAFLQVFRPSASNTTYTVEPREVKVPLL